MSEKANALKERYLRLKSEQPNLRIRNCAGQLGVSEAELLATRVGEGVTRLRPDFEGILKRVPELGHVMALTRNDDVVHERKGEYLNGSFGTHASLFVGEDIDLRIFLSAWATAFAVEEDGHGGKLRKSLQFFGKDGLALHKVYLEGKSNAAAYDSIVAEFRDSEQSPEVTVTPAPAPAAELPDSEIDVDGFRQAWRDLKDTHDFFGMLRKYKVTRTQAMRLAPAGNYAFRVGNSALREVFSRVAERGVPIMVFVGNPGIIQIHTGPVRKLVDHGEWFNVLDPDFNLHLREPAIVQSWVVRKPTEDGTVTSLELFNAADELIATIFGKRKPGIPEMAEWREVVAEVESLFDTVTA